jgi:hypothetical protein
VPTSASVSDTISSSMSSTRLMPAGMLACCAVICTVSSNSRVDTESPLTVLTGEYVVVSSSVRYHPHQPREVCREVDTAPPVVCGAVTARSVATIFALKVTTQESICRQWETAAQESQKRVRVKKGWIECPWARATLDDRSLLCSHASKVVKCFGPQLDHTCTIAPQGKG